MKALVIALGLVALSAQAAWSQDQASPDVISNGSYFEAQNSQVCDGNGCTVSLAKIPEKKSLQAERLSCSIVSKSQVTLVALTSSKKKDGPTSRLYALEGPVNVAAGGSFAANLNQAVATRLQGGRIPLVFINLAAAGQVFADCTLTGRLVN